MTRLAILAALLGLTGCGAVGAATSVVAMPVRAASKAVGAGATLVDATTTSQSERDEKRGGELRRREERLGELDREYASQARACEAGQATACTRRDSADAEIRALQAESY